MASSNSILLPDVELKGKITEKDDIILGCKFDGNIAAHKVNLSKTAEINGDINADEIEVNGKIKGSLAAKRVKIKRGCNFEGDVVGESISIEDGANIKIQALTKKGA
ncbi:Integral membrane protein CcmA involved in cell shape determination [alpha proteobacterium HIMB114]|nr:Integral membrane protein CcmA involved in cell shape determination [alpha proteobacterium HIMB114]